MSTCPRCLNPHHELWECYRDEGKTLRATIASLTARATTAGTALQEARAALEQLIPWVEAYRVGPCSSDKMYEFIGKVLDTARAALTPQTDAARGAK